MDERPFVWNGRLVVGLLLAALGVMWTLDNFGLVNAGDVLRWWPALLIAYGVAKLSGLGACRNTRTGTIATILGTVLLVGNVGMLHLAFWPLVLMAAGVAMILRALERDRPGGSGDSPRAREVHGFAILGGSTMRRETEQFRGGDLFAMLGAVEIDLTAAKMEQERAVVDVFALMGGLVVHVPQDWRVELEVTPLLGGIEGNTGPAASEPKGTLVLRGAVVMGGLQVDRKPMGERGEVVIGVSGRRRRAGVVHTQVRFGDQGVIEVTKNVTEEPSKPVDPK